VDAERAELVRRAEALAEGERALERRRELDQSAGQELRARQAEIDSLRAENAALRAEVVALRERAVGQEETIGRMMAAGQKLIRQRNELRARVPHPDGATT
jgi:chromosome segregation ATPase